MSFLQVFLLSILQGITEFIPISSSGHLVLADALFGATESNLPFVVLVHAGTLVAILVVFRRWLLELVRYACCDGWKTMAEAGWKKAWYDNPMGRMIVAIVIATIPTGLIGFLGEDFFENLFAQPQKVGMALCVTGILLALTLSRKSTSESSPPSAPHVPFPLWMAFLIGTVQGLAVTPGISRSGSTIALAILLGINRRSAWEFSFLIGIPAIVGGVLVDMLNTTTEIGISMNLAIMAFALSALFGWISLKILQSFVVRRGLFASFSIYCFAVGIWAIFYF